MKTKLVIAILLICASISSIANPKSRDIEISKTIPVSSDYNKISVGKNISVIFVKMQSAVAVVNGTVKSSANLDIKVVEGTLFITSKRYVASNSITIYLPAKNLSEINLGENAKIHSEDIMKCNDLTVYLSGGSYASLITQGKIEYKAIGDIELDVERYKAFHLKSNDYYQGF